MTDTEQSPEALRHDVDSLTELVTILLRSSKPALDEAYESYDMEQYDPEADPQHPDSARAIIAEARKPRS